MNATTASKATRLTNNEIELLRGIDKSEYGELLTHAVWSFSIGDNSPLTSRAIGGVAASLVKKGYVVCTASGTDEATIQMTDAGIAAYLAVVGKSNKPTSFDPVTNKAVWTEVTKAASKAPVVKGPKAVDPDAALVAANAKRPLVMVFQPTDYSLLTVKMKDGKTHNVICPMPENEKKWLEFYDNETVECILITRR